MPRARSMAIPRAHSVTGSAKTGLVFSTRSYFYQGTGTKKSRLYHAVSNAWITRGDSGKTVPNYAYILGIMGSGALSNTYYPHADRGASLVFTNALLGFAGRAGGNVLQEFIVKHLTKNASKPANAQP
jgi:hypothetical protein